MPIAGDHEERWCLVVSMEYRISRFLAELAESNEMGHVEETALGHLRDALGCDAAYLATIGPGFVARCSPVFQRILADPNHYDPGQRKAMEIMARFGPAFIDTEAYSSAEQDRSPIFRELLRPMGISSSMLAALQLSRRTTGVVHLLRSGSRFLPERLREVKPLLHAISIAHHAFARLPAPAQAPLRDVSAIDTLERLTPREREVAKLAASGHGAIQIAARLGTSPHTVRRQIESIYRKCAVGNRAELATLVARAQRGAMIARISRARPRDNLLRILASGDLTPAVRAEDWEASG